MDIKERVISANRRVIRFTVVVLLVYALLHLCFGGQAYYSPLSINAAQVPSTQTDFPVLVSQTDNRFKTIGNGGHVANSNGYDIRPYSDSGLTTAITGYELERYNASTGEVIMWVKVGSLSSSTTPIYLGYGDSSLTTDGSSTTTWSNNFTAVYHFKDGTSLNVNDSTSGAYNATNHSATATTGQIDGGVAFNGSSQYLDTDSTVPPMTVAFTYTVWLDGNGFSNDYNAIIDRGSGSDDTAIFVKSNTKIYWKTSPVFSDGGGSHSLSTATWYYLAMAYDSTNGLKAYVNASSDVTVAASGNQSTTSIATDFARQRSTGIRFFDGKLDETRISSVARSANWITTEYNNQSAPATFETLGTEVPLAVANGWLFFFP